MKPRIIITGKESFIGKYIIKHLQAYDISEVDIRNIDPANINFGDAEILIQLAAIVHQPKIKDKNLYKKVNTELPVQIAKEAKKAGVKHFIQFSSIAVYGDVEYIDINTKTNPNTLYGISKLNADTKLLEMQTENFNVSIIRPPMVYGGEGAPGNMHKLISFALKGYYLPFKKVNNKKDFINVHNLVEAVSTVIKNRITGIILPTDKNAISTEDILKCISRLSSKKIRYFTLSKFILNILKIIFPNKVKKLFGTLSVECSLSKEYYQPSYTFESGINEMLKFIERS